jgi:hypothetical protein
MIWALVGLGLSICSVAALLYFREPLRCPECGSTAHEVDRWIHYGHDRAVRKCADCGNVWCAYPGIEIEEADDAWAEGGRD